MQQSEGSRLSCSKRSTALLRSNRLKPEIVRKLKNRFGGRTFTFREFSKYRKVETLSLRDKRCRAPKSTEACNLGVRSCNTFDRRKNVISATATDRVWRGYLSCDKPRQRAPESVFSDADRELFLSTLAGVVSCYGWICYACRLMANHYHLSIEAPKAISLSACANSMGCIFKVF
jgi:hypothetical protein